MTTRDKAPVGSPCWCDLWTSDVEGARSFYGELFAWEALPPAAEFGGYFMWTRDGVPVAGGMGDMGEMKATDTWSIYLQTDDIAAVAETAVGRGAQLLSPAMPVADLGVQLVMIDPTGAHLGAWQPGTFEGFTVLDEPGAQDWFELHTRDHATAVEFYRSVFRWNTNAVADTDEFRYTTLKDVVSGAELAGIMDAAQFLPAESPAYWTIYFKVDDVDVSCAKVAALGGSVMRAAEDTPYGRVATVADPFGATFRLHRPDQ